MPCKMRWIIAILKTEFNPKQLKYTIKIILTTKNCYVFEHRVYSIYKNNVKMWIRSKEGLFRITFKVK